MALQAQHCTFPYLFLGHFEVVRYGIWKPSDLSCIVFRCHRIALAAVDSVAWYILFSVQNAVNARSLSLKIEDSCSASNSTLSLSSRQPNSLRSIRLLRSWIARTKLLNAQQRKPLTHVDCGLQVLALDNSSNESTGERVTLSPLVLSLVFMMIV